MRNVITILEIAVFKLRIADSREIGLRVNFELSAGCFKAVRSRFDMGRFAGLGFGRANRLRALFALKTFLGLLHLIQPANNLLNQGFHPFYCLIALSLDGLVRDSLLQEVQPMAPLRVRPTRRETRKRFLEPDASLLHFCGAALIDNMPVAGQFKFFECVIEHVGGKTGVLLCIVKALFEPIQPARRVGPHLDHGARQLVQSVGNQSIAHGHVRTDFLPKGFMHRLP